MKETSAQGGPRHVGTNQVIKRMKIKQPNVLRRKMLGMHMLYVQVESMRRNDLPLEEKHLKQLDDRRREIIAYANVQLQLKIDLDATWDDVKSVILAEYPNILKQQGEVTK